MTLCYKLFGVPGTTAEFADAAKRAGNTSVTLSRRYENTTQVYAPVSLLGDMGFALNMPQETEYIVLTAQGYEFKKPVNVYVPDKSVGSVDHTALFSTVLSRTVQQLTAAGLTTEVAPELSDLLPH